jgi:hypothetical protein
LDERQAWLEMANLDPDITTEDLMRGWHSAGTAAAPRAGAQGRGSGVADDVRLRSQFADEWHRMHPDEKDPTTGHLIHRSASSTLYSFIPMERTHG